MSVLVSFAFLGVLTGVIFSAWRADRLDAFRDRCLEQARIELALAAELPPGDVTSVVAVSERRAEFETISASDGITRSSLETLTLDDVPPALRMMTRAGRFEVVRADFDGRDHLVVGGPVPRSDAVQYFFHPLDGVDGDIRRARLVALVGWLAASAAAGLACTVAVRADR